MILLFSILLLLLLLLLFALAVRRAFRAVDVTIGHDRGYDTHYSEAWIHRRHVANKVAAVRGNYRRMT